MEAEESDEEDHDESLDANALVVNQIGHIKSNGDLAHQMLQVNSIGSM